MEYLAPGVYIEEVPSGNKPIEGASTSTAGMVGVTQRGPVNVPTFVTSFGEFNRTFGGLLDHRTFTDNRDALPYAIQGFFNNGGQRVYVSRVIGPDAECATADIYAEPIAEPASLTLAARAAAGANALLVESDENLVNGLEHTELLIADDVRTEYVSASGPATPVGVRLTAGLRAEAAAATNISAQTVADGADLSAAISGDMQAGGGLELDAAAIGTLNANDIIEVFDTADPARREFVTIATASTTDLVETGLLFDHPVATAGVRVVTLGNDETTEISEPSAAGSALLRLDITGFTAGSVVRITGGGLYVVANTVHSIALSTPLDDSHSSEVRVIKQTPMLRVHAHYPGLWGNLLRARVRNSSTLETIAAAAQEGENVVVLSAVFGLNAGSYVRFSDADTVLQTLRVSSVNRATNEVSFSGPLTVDLADRNV